MALVANKCSYFEKSRDDPSFRYDMRTAVHDPTNFYNVELSSKDGDWAEPIGITFDLSGPLSPGQLKYFYIVVGGHTIFSVPISLLESIGSTNTTSTQHTISFNLRNSYFHRLNLCRLYNAKCVFGVCVESPTNINSVKIHTSYTYFLAGDRKREKASNECVQDIKQFETVWGGGEDVESYEITIPFKSISLGYMIEGDIESLSRFALILNGMYLHNLSSEMLFVAGKRLGPRLLSIPFSPCSLATIAQEKIDNIMCKLTFTKPQKSYAIHSMTMNKFITKDGRGNLCYQGFSLAEGKVPISMVSCPDDNAEEQCNSSYLQQIKSFFK